MPTPHSPWVIAWKNGKTPGVGDSDQIIGIADTGKTSLLLIRAQARQIVRLRFIDARDIRPDLGRERRFSQSFRPRYAIAFDDQLIGPKGLSVEEDGATQTKR
jgi:hypothetical protein